MEPFLFMHPAKELDSLIVDSREYSNDGRFIRFCCEENNSKDRPNAALQSIICPEYDEKTVHGPNSQHIIQVEKEKKYKLKLALISTKDIKKGEEVILDTFSNEHWLGYPCICGDNKSNTIENKDDTLSSPGGNNINKANLHQSYQSNCILDKILNENSRYNRKLNLFGSYNNKNFAINETLNEWVQRTTPPTNTTNTNITNSKKKKKSSKNSNSNSGKLLDKENQGQIKNKVVKEEKRQQQKENEGNIETRKNNEKIPIKMENEVQSSDVKEANIVTNNTGKHEKINSVSSSQKTDNNEKELYHGSNKTSVSNSKTKLPKKNYKPKGGKKIWMKNFLEEQERKKEEVKRIEMQNKLKEELFSDEFNINTSNTSVKNKVNTKKNEKLNDNPQKEEKESKLKNEEKTPDVNKIENEEKIKTEYDMDIDPENKGNIQEYTYILYIYILIL